MKISYHVFRAYNQNSQLTLAVVPNRTATISIQGLAQHQHHPIVILPFDLDMKLYTIESITVKMYINL